MKKKDLLILLVLFSFLLWLSGSSKAEYKVTGRASITIIKRGDEEIEKPHYNENIDNLDFILYSDCEPIINWSKISKDSFSDSKTILCDDGRNILINSEQSSNKENEQQVDFTIFY